MKKIITYISLPILSGLIFLFYISPGFNSNRAKICPNLSNAKSVIKMANKMKADEFSIPKAIAGELFPVLKSLN
jgi:acid phosphatase class B